MNKKEGKRRGRQVKASVVRELSRQVVAGILGILDLTAEGDTDAAAELHGLASMSVVLLNACAQKSPAMFRSIAEHRVNWPMLYNPHRDSKRTNDAYVKSLCLGRRTNINISESGKPFSWTRPRNQVAWWLLQIATRVKRAPIRKWSPHDHAVVAICGVGARPHGLASNYRQRVRELEKWGQHGAGSRLPELNRETAGLWAAETPHLIRLAFGEDFHEHPSLRTLREAIDPASKKSKTALRNMMRQSVAQAWESLARTE